MTERAIYLTASVLPFVPMRHWVLSVPFELRYWMAADDKILKKVNQILCQEINNYLRKKARKLGRKWGETGIISFLQRAGSAVNLNLHFHLLALDGIYSLDDAGEAIFTRVSGIKNDEISRVLSAVSRRVLKYLRHVGRLPAEGEEVYIGDQTDDPGDTLSHIKRASISSRVALGPRAGLKIRRIGASFGYEEEIPKIQGYGCASMNGFSIHAATSIKAHERDRLEKLLRYLGRGPISNEKISLDKDGNILYELKKSYDGATHALFSPQEFIEKLASIIPPAFKHQVNYYGCLSSHHKMRPLIIKAQPFLETPAVNAAESTVGLPEEGPMQKPPPAIEIKRKAAYIPWAELLKRMFEVDLTVCPCCQGRLRVIAAVIRSESIQKILSHLGLSTGPPKQNEDRQTEYVMDSFA